MKIDIIGGGIGGLTAAIALQRKNHQIKIYEQSKEIKAVGAGIILANNAMQIYDRLGLKSEIEDAGNVVSSVNITTKNLSVLSAMDLSKFEKKYGVKNIAIHRAELQKILINNLNSDSLLLNHQLQSIENKGKGYFLNFSNQLKYPSEFIIAADGINSKVRNQVFRENKIRNANQKCWRGVTNYIMAKEYQNQLNEAWGKGNRFGFVQIAPEKVYWFALKTIKDDEENDLLNHVFKDYHPMIKEIIESTENKEIHTSNITDLKPIKKWYTKRICLIGDAAHATTPNMGQGACQSIESAYVLAECLSKYDLEESLLKYQKIRISKAHAVVNQSMWLGKMAHLKNPMAIALRNIAMKMTPKSLTTKQSAWVFRPPEI